jgi:hypothetical protein
VTWLRNLDCTRCRLLTSLSNLPSLRILNCRGCPWLHGSHFQYLQNLENLTKLQSWARQHLPSWRFQRWIRSEGFAMWFYSPERSGGRISKREIAKTVSRICRKRTAETEVEQSPTKRRKIGC